jgi:hypothetical protein
LASERLIKAQERLNAYYAAELAVLSGQEYKLGSRSLVRADLAEIRKSISDLENFVDELKSVDNGTGKRRAFRITPRDL